MIFSDVVVESSFIKDWDSAPVEIRERVDRKINQLACERLFRPSANLHRIHKYEEDLWIMYLNMHSAGGWRMIVRIQDQILFMKRLLDHEDMMEVYGR
jgi:mRNA-degrading endonuclease RelE of RelBE toxin-antitoxin system